VSCEEFMFWQSVETAPRDGTQFWGLVGDDAISMSWHPTFNAFVSSFRRMTLAPGYTFEDGATFQDHSPTIHEPSLWAPLPKVVQS
jgi:hypothetical protein